MRRGSLLLLVVFAGLYAAADAAAYPWPLKPFDRQHPIRANFGDPRTRFWNGMLANGLAGPGMFQFHNGVDIAAPDGTPVYAVTSGTAHLINAAAVLVRSKGRKFQYFHVVPQVLEGQRVVARKTIIGYIVPAFGHVHLSEIRAGRVWNPLAAGGLVPYRDRTVPQIDSITMRGTWSLLPLDAAHVCGSVSIVATALDEPPVAVTGAWAGFPVSPAYVTWTFQHVGGTTYVHDVPAADFRTTLPTSRNFWNVYARGSFQNAPRFSGRQYVIAGRYVYNLANIVDTRWYPNGVYDVTVHAEDMRGNAVDQTERFTIDNRGDCPIQVPSSSP